MQSVRNAIAKVQEKNGKGKTVKEEKNLFKEKKKISMDQRPKKIIRIAVHKSYINIETLNIFTSQQENIQNFVKINKKMYRKRRFISTANWFIYIDVRRTPALIEKAKLSRKNVAYSLMLWWNMRANKSWITYCDQLEMIVWYVKLSVSIDVLFLYIDRLYSNFHARMISYASQPVSELTKLTWLVLLDCVVGWRDSYAT